MPTPLTEIIASEIATGGAMSFRRFMELALYHPEFGYYSSGQAKIGRKGDFFTNVSVGPLFGKLLALQFAEQWRLLGQPADFSIVEQGAHGGEFAADVLEALRTQAPDCFAVATYRIVEPSEALTARQRERLAGHRVAWAKTLDGLPPITGVHFSNELPDAFPVHLVRWEGARWREQFVRREKGEFAFEDRALSSHELAEACAAIPQPLPPGYTTEVNLAARAWIREVASRLVRGYVVCIDYGHLRREYYAPERVEGTLSAYAQHQRVQNPLADPGTIDLTAHVDFTALLEAGESAGLAIAGYTDQHHLMVGLGAEYFKTGEDNGGGSPPPPSELRAFQTLMHPQFMGLAFKAAVLTKDAPTTLTGLKYARPLTDWR